MRFCADVFASDSDSARRAAAKRAIQGPLLNCFFTLSRSSSVHHAYLLEVNRPFKLRRSLALEFTPITFQLKDVAVVDARGRGE